MTLSLISGAVANSEAVAGLGLVTGPSGLAVNQSLAGLANSRVETFLPQFALTGPSQAALAIQAALNQGSNVSLTTPGIYSVNAALFFNSATRFTLGNGVTLQLAANTNAPMLRTASSLVTPTAVTLTWVSGASVTVTWTAHGLTTDDYICIQGVATAQPQYNQIAKVFTVVDANNVTILLPIVPIAAATGSPTAIKCTRDFVIEGGTLDWNSAGQGGATFVNTICVQLAFAANFSVRNMNLLNFTRGFNLGGCMDYSVTNIKGTGRTAGGSELYKTYGPVRNGYASTLSGTTSDDFASIQPIEDVAFVGYRFSLGNIVGLTHENFDGQNSGGASIIPIYGDDVYFATGVRLNNIQGNSITGQSIVSFEKGQSTTLGLHGSIEVNGVHGSTTGRQVLFNTVSCDKIVIRNVTARGTGIGSNSGVAAAQIVIEDVEHNPISTTDKAVDFNINNTTGIRKLKISRVHSKNTISASGTAIIGITASTAVSLVEWEVEGCVNETPNTRLLSMAIAGAKSGHIHDCVQTAAANGDAFWNVAAVVASVYNVTLENNYIEGFQNIAVASAGGAITLNLVARNNQCTNGLAFLRANQVTNAIAVNYSGGGNTFSVPGNFWVIAAGAPTISIKDWDVVFDVGLTGIAATIGQYARHSSAVAGRNAATQQGNCIANGTNWVALATGAAQVNVLII